MESPWDFNNRRALAIEGDDDARMVATTVQDLVNVVVRAVEYDGEWPVVGGIKGSEFSVGELIALGEKIRGTLCRAPVVPYLPTGRAPVRIKLTLQ